MLNRVITIEVMPKIIMCALIAVNWVSTSV